MSYDPKAIAEPVTKIASRPQNRRFVVNYLDNQLSSCITIFRRLPWLVDIIDQIYVRPINMDISYYDSQSFVEYKDEKFFSVKRKYYLMRCQGELINIGADDVFTVNYDNNILSFQVGIKTKKHFVVETSEMAKDEIKFLENWNKLNTNIRDLKLASVTNELKLVAKTNLLDYLPNSEFADKLIKHLDLNSSDSNEFANKVAMIITGARFGNTFPKKLKKNYYDPNFFNLIDYSDLFEGVEYDKEQVDDYIEYTSSNLLVYASKYYEIPERKYVQKTKKVPVFKNVNIKIKCDNFEDIRNIDEENIAFYETNGKLLCYDIQRLYKEFSNGNYINIHTGVNFTDEFINKIKNLYKFKKTFSKESDDEDYDVFDEFARQQDDEEDDKLFKLALSKLRLEIDSLGINNDKCTMCKRAVGRTGIITLNQKGEILKSCSRACFDKL